MTTEDILKIASDAFQAGEAYATGSHKDFKQTHLSREEYLEQVAAEIGKKEGRLKMKDMITIPIELLESLVDSNDCWFDHHGGCQAHGFLSLEPGEKCPHQEAKDLLAEIGRR